MKKITSTPSPPSDLLPAFVILFLLLSDDDYQIRHRASEVTSYLLSEQMTYTPMEASEKLTQLILDTFPAEPVEEEAIKLIVATDVRKEISGAMTAEETLFAKERENIWRDEIYQLGLYIRVLSQCWSRQMGSTIHSPVDNRLMTWTKEGLTAIMKVVAAVDDTVLGWSQENDIFESIMKVLLVIEVMVRYGKAGEVHKLVEETRDIMVKRKSHAVWREKLEEICGSMGPMVNGVDCLEIVE